MKRITKQEPGRLQGGQFAQANRSSGQSAQDASCANAHPLQELERGGTSRRDVENIHGPDGHSTQFGR